MTHAADRRGFALVVVLWILVSVGATSMALHAATRGERRVVSNARAASESQWAARAGLARFMHQLNQRLSQRGGGTLFATVGDTMLPPLQFVQGNVDVHVVMLDPRAKININVADEGQLRKFFVALGISDDRALPLAHAVLDWRDPDEVRRRHGAERPTYTRARQLAGPKNAPFDSVEELIEVYGVDMELYDRAVGFVTVTGDGRINVNSASVPVLATLPDVDLAAARKMVTRRRASRYRGPLDVLEIPPGTSREAARSRLERLAERVAFTAGEAEITVTARAPEAPVGTRLHVAVELGGGSQWRVARTVQR